MNLVQILLVSYFVLNVLITIFFKFILPRKYKILYYLSPILGVPFICLGLISWFLCVVDINWFLIYSVCYVKMQSFKRFFVRRGK